MKLVPSLVARPMLPRLTARQWLALSAYCLFLAVVGFGLGHYGGKYARANTVEIVDGRLRVVPRPCDCQGSASPPKPVAPGTGVSNP